jgi:hypothetical protein
MKKSVLKSAIVAALGATAIAATPAHAGVSTFNWNGYFTMLDGTGAALANTSITGRGANQYQTPVTGTMQFDNVSGAGTATLDPFGFFNNPIPAEAVGINMQSIGDGMGGAGTLVLGNMLFNWGGNYGIPVSIVLDAAGFFAGEMTAGGPAGAIPASDGTYASSTYPSLNLGSVPMATTAWNTSPNCTNGVDCIGNGTNGVLPLVQDNTVNAWDATANIGGNGTTTTTGGYTVAIGIGGSPMLDGPFTGYNANFDVTQLTPTGYDDTASLPPNCSFDPSGNLCPPTPTVPVPAAVWLFGSGLLGLVGVARRKVTKV